MDKVPRVRVVKMDNTPPKPRSLRRVEVKKMKSVQIDPRTNMYIKNKIAGMNNTQAALQAGFPRSIARKAAERVETPEVKRRMLQILDDIGLSDVHLANFLKEGLTEANKTFGTGDNFVETPDYGVRHKYLETALKLRGELQGEPREKEDIKIVIVDYETDKHKPTT